ncbi:MAG: GTPase ObgE [bacterium]|nr:GTPase ObgE [bacterium]
MFVDRARIFACGGRGGNGCLSFRREKFVPRGGPDGGDGGNGGSVILQSDPSLHTLLDLRYHPHNVAESGAHGKGKQMHGKRGADLTIRVPFGTLIKDASTDHILWDFQIDGRAFVAAHGGRGGGGNTRFKTSTNRAPRRATPGTTGEERWLLVELKLLADIGLLGFPNVGKSTLISAISAAKPKIASYPFTTLTPHLGVVQLPNFSTCIVADIPGLIPGAHSGKGLGLQFLKHIERTLLLVHLLDLVSEDEGRSPWDDFTALNHELACFKAQLSQIPQLIVATKMDVPRARNRLPEVQHQFNQHGYEVLPISAATGEGIAGLIDQLTKHQRTQRR